MSSKRDILKAQLKAIDPVSADDLEGTLPEHVMAAILATHPDDTGQEVAHRRSIPKWRLVPIAAALLAALVLATGLLGGGDGDEGVRSALTEVASAAAAQSPPSADGEYLFRKTRTLSVDTAVAKGQAWSVYRSETRQEWASRNGAGLVRTEADPLTFVGPGDRAAWVAAGSPHFADLGGPVRTSEESLPAGSFENLAGLPTNSAALADHLHAEAEATHKSAPIPARMLELIGEALRNPSASPELRAALYEAALQAPGMNSSGRQPIRMGARVLRSA